MKAIKIGKMRHRLVFKTPSRTSDGKGGATAVTWSTFSTVWGDLQPASANQVIRAQALQHEVTHVARIRPLANVTSKMRVEFDSRVFHVQGYVDLVEQGREMHVFLKEGVQS